MNSRDIKSLTIREPFRPFSVRLTNGAEYAFNEPRDFGATRDFGMIFWFGESEAVRIDSGHIAEIIERNSTEKGGEQ